IGIAVIALNSPLQGGARHILSRCESEASVGRGFSCTRSSLVGSPCETCRGESMPTRTPVTIIVIDDDPLQLKLIRARLAELHPALEIGEVATFTDATEALAHLPMGVPVAILCDIDMPGGTGLNWL